MRNSNKRSSTFFASSRGESERERSPFTLASRNRTVLGIDPGYERLGVALLSDENGRQRIIHSDCVQTDASLPFPERLARLHEVIEELLDRHTPQALALERLFFNKNQKTAMGVAEVRGMLLALGAGRGIPIFEYTPGQVKVAVTGHGASEKAQVAGMLQRLLSIEKLPRFDDEYDAIAVALTCLVSERF